MWSRLSKISENLLVTNFQKGKKYYLLDLDAADKILTYETLPDVINYFRQNGYTFMNLYDIV